MLAQDTAVLLALPLAVSRSGLLFQHGISEITSSGSGLWVLPGCWVGLPLPLRYWTRLPGMLWDCPWHDLQPPDLTLGRVLPGPEPRALKLIPSAVAWKALRILS